jgi:3-hydroxyacyl-[acyl-carrier-protein] dehydratase
MLLDTFYSIVAYEQGEKSARATLRFNPDHPIFAGHFPAVPVVPGVCMMQMVQEMVEKQAGVKTNIDKVSVMKFLTLINPLQVSSVDMDLSYILSEDDIFLVTASLFNGAVVYFKFKGILRQAHTGSE